MIVVVEQLCMLVDILEYGCDLCRSKYKIDSEDIKGHKGCFKLQCTSCQFDMSICQKTPANTNFNFSVFKVGPPTNP